VNAADEDDDNNVGAILAIGALTAVAGGVAYYLINDAGTPRVDEPRKPASSDPEKCEPCKISKVENLQTALPGKRYIWVEDDHVDYLSVNAKQNPSKSSIDDRAKFDKQGGFSPSRK